MAKQGFNVFDSDMHIMEPPDLWPRYIDPEFKDQAPRGVTSGNVRDLRTYFPGVEQPPAERPNRDAGHNFDRNQALYKDHSERGWGPDVQLEAMDVEGIDAAVLFPTRGLSILTRAGMDPRFANAVARAYNDWLAEFCQKDPKRLLGSGMISVHNIDDAVAETRRVVKDYGFTSVFLRSNIVNGHNWYEPYYEPLWNTLEELEIPVGFHEATGSRSGRQVGDNFDPNFGIRRIYSQPVEQMMGLGALLCGGVLARHPKLKVAFLEANCSWVPWLIWRADEGYEREGDIFMQDLDMMPSEYFRRQCWVSIEPDEEPAKYMIEEFGADQLVFSTDYPHGDSKYPEAVENFLKLSLPDETKRKILWDNCARFYAVGLPVAAS
jgi:uncharacterized protein